MTTEEKQAGAPSMCFAPPLNDTLLKHYAELATTAPPPVRDAMETLLRLVLKWWKLPTSKLEGKLHKAGTGMHIPLEDKHQEDLYEDIPWEHELVAMNMLFDTIPYDGPMGLNNAAKHLVWHAIELFRDREPITRVEVAPKKFIVGHTDEVNAQIGR